MYRIEPESFGLFCPDIADVFVGREPLQGFKSLSEIVGHDEALQALAKLVMAFIVIALDRRVLDRSVHPLDLAVCPGVIDFGQPVFDFVFIADTLEDVPEGVFLPGLIGELDAVVGQNRVDPVGNDLDKVA